MNNIKSVLFDSGVFPRFEIFHSLPLTKVDSVTPQQDYQSSMEKLGVLETWATGKKSEKKERVIREIPRT